MPRAYLCSECVSAGVTLDDDGYGSADLIVACSFCGAINEQATYARNAVDVHDTYGALMNEHGTSTIQFHEYKEKKHEEFVDKLLHAYLVDPTSRLVDRPADHFKAGVKTWYNRYRKHEQARQQLKNATTNSDAQKVKYLVAVAVHMAVLESNVVVINNRLAHLRRPTSSCTPAARGDGTIIAPSLNTIFSRAHALGPTHIGYLSSESLLRVMFNRMKRIRNTSPSALEVVLSQVYGLMQHLQFLSRLPHAIRLQHLAVKDLKPAAVREGKTVETADPDDFILGNEEWEYISTIDWNRTFDMAYNLYCVQQAIALWGNRCTIDISSALLQWAIMAAMGTVMPSVSAWSRQLGRMFGGTEAITSRRREEVKDLVIGWGTSFLDAGIPVPIIPAPRKGTVGDGLAGYGSDKRRAIPETIMAVAFVPGVAIHWRHIMATRLRTRTQALPLDAEFTMAARMLAKAYEDNQHETRRRAREASAQRKAAKIAADKAAKREARVAKVAEKKAAKAASAPASRQTSLTPKRRYTKAANRATSQPPHASVIRHGPPPPSPSIEALLATQEDSSDEEGGHGSDDDQPSLPSARGVPSIGDVPMLDPAGDTSSVPFGFSIGPNGFTVATTESTATVPVGPPLFRLDTSKRSISSIGPESIQSEPPKKRRKAIRPPIQPMSPAPTSSSTLSPLSRGASLSPAPSDATGYPRGTSATPSLRSITMSPSLTAVSTTPAVEPLPNDSAHIGCLIRERSQYAFYNLYNEQRKGGIVSADVERAMSAWVEDAKAKGIIPEHITTEYRASLGFNGDPRVDDLGPYIHSNPQWSPTESLLRLGVRPVEFPVNFVVYSLIDLKQQLGGFRWDDRLQPIGRVLDAAQLDAELDTLFASGEQWRDLLATPAEANRKEKVYLKSGLWTYARDIPEGPVNQLDKDNFRSSHKRKGRKKQPLVDAPPRSSRRIDMAVLERLTRERRDGDDDDAEGDSKDSDDDEGLVGDVLHETLWSAMGDGAGGGEYEYEDDDAEEREEEHEKYDEYDEYNEYKYDEADNDEEYGKYDEEY